MLKHKKFLYFVIFLIIILSLLFLINSFKSNNSTSLGVSGEVRDNVLVGTIQPEVKSEEIEKTNSFPDESEELVKVVKVIDGDTIKIETGEVVRLIGIDAPETVHPSKSVACFGKESSEKAKEVLGESLVRLEKDVSEKDKYGRLLRYVWKGGLLVNELLVREGYATVSTYPPDVKYQDRFLEAQRLAREENRGLWAECSNEKSKNTIVTKNQPVYSGTGSYTCDCSKTCAKISSCDEAQYQLNVCGCKARDADGDGVACDSICQ